MKIEYKILWLDDKIQNFIDDELLDDIESFLIENGFKPAIDTTANIEDFFEKLDDSYDLIMTDYHMDKMNGHEVVEKIRGTQYAIFTEILFYTAQASLGDANNIDRVSYLATNSKMGSHEETLIEETKKLIGLTIKKFQHIVVMRGMIMHETSSLDSKMLKILEDFISTKENMPHITDIGQSIVEELKSQFRRKTKLIDNCHNSFDIKKFKKVYKDNFVFSAAYKIMTMGEILKLKSLEDFSDAYQKEINVIRNIFAHAILERNEETGKECFKNGEIIFDESLCRKIRKDIIKHERNLDSLESQLA